MSVLTLYFCGTNMDHEAHRDGELIATLAKNSKNTPNHTSFIYNGPGSNRRLSIFWLKENLLGDGWEKNVANSLKYILAHPEITTLNLVGWSRGAITCFMLANKLVKHPIKINIIAVDPVPGHLSFSADKVTLNANVINFYGIYAKDDRSHLLQPVIPRLHPSTKEHFYVSRGNHFTAVGLKRPSVTSPLRLQRDDETPAIGQIIRHYVESKLRKHGTVFSESLGYSRNRLLALYDEIKAYSRWAIAKLQLFVIGWSTVFSRWVAKGQQSIAKSYHDIAHFIVPDGYTNQHHQDLEADKERAKEKKRQLTKVCKGDYPLKDKRRLLYKAYQQTLFKHHFESDKELEKLIATAETLKLNTLEILSFAAKVKNRRLLVFLFKADTGIYSLYQKLKHATAEQHTEICQKALAELKPTAAKHFLARVLFYSQHAKYLPMSQSVRDSLCREATSLVNQIDEEETATKPHGLAAG